MPLDLLAGPRRPVLDRGPVAADQPLRELSLGLGDRAADRALELDRQVGHAAGRDVGGDVDLLAADDAEVDDGLPGGGVEARGRPG